MERCACGKFNCLDSPGVNRHSQQPLNMTLSLTLGQRETCNVTEAEAALGVSFEAVCKTASHKIEPFFNV
jgi:hypothetical protein